MPLGKVLPRFVSFPQAEGNYSPTSLTAFFRNLLPHQKGESKDTLKIVILRICTALNTALSRRVLKAYIRYFLSNFYFSLDGNPSKTMKNVFLFHLKSSFCSQIF